MKRLVLGMLLTFSIGNAKWMTTYELAEFLQNDDFKRLAVRNKSFELKFVADVESADVLFNNSGRIIGIGNVKARIIKRIPSKTSLRCGETLLFKYGEDVIDWKGAVSLAGKFHLKDCF